MSRYARFIDYSAEQDDSDVRAIDVVDIAAYDPRPGWYTTDEAFLERIFAPQLVSQWKAGGHWFVEVPNGVQPGAIFSGSDHSNPASYINADGTDGDGELPEGDKV